MAKSNSPKLQRVTSTIPQELVAQLDALAKTRSTNRSQVIREFVEWGMRINSSADELRHDLHVNREENRQLTALLLANLNRDVSLDVNSVPGIIEKTVAYAHSLMPDR